MDLPAYLAQSGNKPTDFAEKIGLAPSIITRLLRGDRGVSLGTAIKISDATGGAVTVRELVAQPQQEAE